jgi:hypothetical protein
MFLVIAVGRREGIHQSVAKDVASVFKGKTASQLAALQNQIEKKIADKGEGIDIGYWESLLSQLKGENIFILFYSIGSFRLN